MALEKKYISDKNLVKIIYDNKNNNTKIDNDLYKLKYIEGIYYFFYPKNTKFCKENNEIKFKFVQFIDTNNCVLENYPKTVTLSKFNEKPVVYFTSSDYKIDNNDYYGNNIYKI